MDRRIIRPRGQGLTVAGDGFRRSPLVLAGIREIGERPEMVGIDPHGALEASQGLDRAPPGRRTPGPGCSGHRPGPAGVESPARSCSRASATRPWFKSARPRLLCTSARSGWRYSACSKLEPRFLQSAQGHQGQPHVRVRPDAVRPEPQGLLVAGDRRVQLAAMHQQGGQLGERTGILGPQLRGTLVAGHRLIGLAEAPQRVAQVEPGLVQVGPELHGPAIAIDGLVWLGPAPPRRPLGGSTPPGRRARVPGRGGSRARPHRDRPVSFGRCPGCGALPGSRCGVAWPRARHRAPHRAGPAPSARLRDRWRAPRPRAQLEGTTKAGHGLVGLAEGMADTPEPRPELGVTGLVLDGLAVELLGLGQGAEALETGGESRKVGRRDHDGARRGPPEQSPDHGPAMIEPFRGIMQKTPTLNQGVIVAEPTCDEPPRTTPCHCPRRIDQFADRARWLTEECVILLSQYAHLPANISTNWALCKRSCRVAVTVENHPLVKAWRRLYAHEGRAGLAQDGHRGEPTATGPEGDGAVGTDRRWEASSLPTDDRLEQPSIPLGGNTISERRRR